MRDMDNNDKPSAEIEPKYVRFEIGDGWSALYVDGRLDKIGDSHNVTERIEELLGVDCQESEVMDAVQQRQDAPKTLADLRVLEAARRTALAEAETLRQQAADLIAQADALSWPGNS
jgi:hypothetical protein